MRKTLLTFLIGCLFFSTAFAESLSQKDEVSFNQVISGQLEAFKAEDGAKAYSYAAPIVTKAFPTVEVFMAMVKHGYQAIYFNSQYEFGVTTTDSLGRPAQHVIITAADRKRYEAVYSMERQQDGTWKIAGVRMVEIAGLDV